MYLYYTFVNLLVKSRIFFNVHVLLNISFTTKVCCRKFLCVDINFRTLKIGPSPMLLALYTKISYTFRGFNKKAYILCKFYKYTFYLIYYKMKMITIFINMNFMFDINICIYNHDYKASSDIIQVIVFF